MILTRLRVLTGKGQQIELILVDRTTFSQFLPNVRVQFSLQFVNTISQGLNRVPDFSTEFEHLIAQFRHLLQPTANVSRQRIVVPVRIVRRELKGIANRARTDPAVELRESRHDRTPRFCRRSTHREPHLVLVSLHRPDTFPQIICDFFPAAQELRWLILSRAFSHRRPFLSCEIYARKLCCRYCNSGILFASRSFRPHCREISAMSWRNLAHLLRAAAC